VTRPVRTTTSSRCSRRRRSSRTWPRRRSGLDRRLRKSQPVVQFIRPYTPDFVGWLRDFGQGASNYDANGHYAASSDLQRVLVHGQPAAAHCGDPNSQKFAECRRAT